MDLHRIVHDGWRQVVGVFFIALGAVSAAFYFAQIRIEQTIVPAKEIVADSPVVRPSLSASILPTPSPRTAKINLLTASQTELESLPRIGPVTAKAIIELRNQGQLKTIQDLYKVKGIGTKTIEQLRPLIEL